MFQLSFYIGVPMFGALPVGMVMKTWMGAWDRDRRFIIGFSKGSFSCFDLESSAGPCTHFPAYVPTVRKCIAWRLRERRQEENSQLPEVGEAEHRRRRALFTDLTRRNSTPYTRETPLHNLHPAP